MMWTFLLQPVAAHSNGSAPFILQERKEHFPSVDEAGGGAAIGATTADLDVATSYVVVGSVSESDSVMLLLSAK